MPDDLLLVALFGALKLLGLGLGAALLLPILRDEKVDARAARGEDEDGGGGSDRRPPIAPRGPRPGEGLPLPDAAPARVRLREPARLADLLPGRRPRRPEHAPEPARAPSYD